MENPEITKVKVIAGVVVKKDGKYLLVQEGGPLSRACRGLWNFPAGKVDLGETFEEAATREAKEESGFDVKIIRKLGIFQSTPTEAVKHAFLAEIIGGEIAYSKEEILDARWFTIDEIRGMKDKLRDNWILDAIEIAENSTNKK
jgi:8-oxo-dGTP pyrophosphatase MutT (NUDIX family)